MSIKESKICLGCGKDKEKFLSEFSLGNNTRLDGTRYHRSRCNECRKIEYRKTHPVVIPQTEKDRQLRAAFDMPEAEYLDKLVKQNGVCAICKKPETVTRLGKLKALAVDHNHTTGKNRGLLCQKCNTGMGQFNESPELLISAAQYLRSYE